MQTGSRLARKGAKNSMHHAPQARAQHQHILYGWQERFQVIDGVDSRPVTVAIRVKSIRGGEL